MLRKVTFLAHDQVLQVMVNRSATAGWPWVGRELVELMAQHLDLFKSRKIATVRLESSTRSDLVLFVRVVISELDGKGHFRRMISEEIFEVLPAISFDVAIALTRELLQRGYTRQRVPRSFGPMQKWAKNVLRMARREEQGHLFF